MLPLAVVVAGVLSLTLILTGHLSISGIPSRDFLIVLGVTQVLFYVWVRGFSRLSLARQIVTLAVFFSLQACLCFSVRLDGFAGDGRPIWTWWWTPTPHESFVESPRKRANPQKIDLRQSSAADYPGFRGRDRTGRAEPVLLSTDWKKFPPRQLWKQPIGSGWSSFAVVGDYCVTQEQREEYETTVCYELKTGREVWSHSDRAHFFEHTSGDGPRATPTIAGGRVYALGATGILNCLDGSSGKRLWAVNVLTDNKLDNRIFGMTGSPLVVGGMVIVSPGGRGSSLVAYDAGTGKPIWKGGDADASYSSPQLAELCDSREVLSFNAEGLFAHDLAGGHVLWSVPWVSNPAERNNVCQPVAIPGPDGSQTDWVFLSSGYGMGSAVLEINRLGDRFSVRERWRNQLLKAKFSSVVVRNGHVYGLDNAILTCIEFSTGRRCWKGGHYGYGQLILVGSLLLVQLESGQVALVDASPETFRERARFTALDGRTWNHPVIAGRYLLVRNDRQAACYELPLESDKPR
ncbi:MAG: PQQ-binding-like beta-propeller repeat protein [Pirellulaceae bacterium]